MTGQQLQVLKALDVAKTQWYHFTAILITGMRFFTDAYDLSCIPLITKWFTRIYYHKEGSYTLGYLPNNVAAAVYGVAFCGTIAGRLFLAGWVTKWVENASALKVLGFGWCCVTVCIPLVTAVVIVVMGFCTDVYDLFCISLVTKLLGRIYYHKEGSYTPSYLYDNVVPPVNLSDNVVAAIIGVALCGTIAGQLFFGWLGDKMGRKCVYGMTLMLVVVYSIASGLSFGKDLKAVMSTLYFFRFWPGFGIEGDYPLFATIMSEYANKKTRGAFIAAAIDRIRSTLPEADYLWRIIVMFGAIPPTLTYYRRTKLLETAHYTVLVAKNAPQAASDMEKVFQVDLEVEQVEQITQEDFAKNNNAIEEVYRNAKAQILIALCSTVPGYWFRVALIDKIDKVGWFAIQLMGFFFMTVFMFALAILYHYWTILEIFPAKLRSTCHGISTAAGKVRAMVGAFGFSAAMHAIGLRKVVIVLGVVNFLGIMFTFLVPESQGKSLEEMSGKADVETADAENGTST
ncbi:hypothetical protein JRO89_XS03G0040700 [Xanthoceras sorbifolium]|uniref:Major facilitator superfamily (MFS) profile domain-containing protein n=1 Tax=Xanthoceras sorbifolium TaxID=99658 RepID=A0ABQ8I8I1_9ROSI|nr:hypothetical protein JRO89_XS03G0040700 [Xanthoceras sorbifolium]